jgi:D-threo-aldose 1-dehydrogenase
MNFSSAPPALDEFVLGCSQLGGLYRPMSDAEAQSVLERAWELGVRHFDTAPHYGTGLSERRLGRFLHGLPRDAFTVSTKVGRLLVDTDEDIDGLDNFYGGDRKRRVLDYSADGVRRSHEESLTRLGLDRVDTLYVHDPEGPGLEAAIRSGYEELHRLRAAGTVTHIGVGTNQTAALARFLRDTEVDQVMLAGRFTLLDRSGGDTLEECHRRGVRVVAAGVFNSGVLAAPGRHARFDYAEAPPELIARAKHYQSVCTRAGVSLRAAAIRFVLRHPAVTQVALGSRTPAHVSDNVAMLLTPVPAAIWSELDPGVTEPAHLGHQ